MKMNFTEKLRPYLNTAADRIQLAILRVVVVFAFIDPMFYIHSRISTFLEVIYFIVSFVLGVVVGNFVFIFLKAAKARQNVGAGAMAGGTAGRFEKQVEIYEEYEDD